MSSDALKNYTFHPTFKMALLAIAAICILPLIFGLFTEPQRTLPTILLIGFYLTTLGLSGLLFMAIQFVTKAGWSTAFRRIPEAMSVAIYPGMAFMIVALIGRHHLYEWSHSNTHFLSMTVGGVGPWLNEPFFILRAFFYYAVWIILGRSIIKASRAQDVSGDINISHGNLAKSAVFLIVFALTVSFASFDWVMSLEHHWYSTMFGVYCFAGLFVNGMATIVLTLVFFQRQGYLNNEINANHYHDLGKLIFGFSCFWAYIWFSQYMLIWYSNIPEETTYFMDRDKGIWGILTLFNLVLNFGIPFFTLLPRPAKRRASYLAIICIVLFFGHWLDLFIMIAHPFDRNQVTFGMIEFTPFIGAFAIFAFAFLTTLSKNNLVPIKDPTLEESLHFHQ
jgi:hypothetical protein